MANGEPRASRRKAWDKPEPEPAAGPRPEPFKGEGQGVPRPLSWDEIQEAVQSYLRRWQAGDKRRPLNSSVWLHQGDGYSAEDHVSQAIVKLLEAWMTSAAPLPCSAAEVDEQISCEAARGSEAARKRESKRRMIRARAYENYSMPSLFDEVSQRDEQGVTFKLLYKVLGDRARKLLTELLIEGAEYGKNKELAARLETSVTEIVNLKRQIERHGRRILIDFLLDRSPGE